ncbi:MAG: hypothetical protein JWM12_304 [Ilumatobacteraceae bacterium]|nr:hypothetical protein [Ilumatobacteraceae bacterium]
MTRPSTAQELTRGGAQPVVALLDGSSCAATTRDWAASEAATRGSTLLAVTSLTGPGSTAGLTDAQVLILGAPGTGSVTRALLDTLSPAGRRRLPCPVIVLRGRQRQPLRRVVVGLGGSLADEAARQWAVDEAALHGAELVVVHAWQPSVGARATTWQDTLDRSSAQRVVDRAVRACSEQFDGAARGTLVEGDACAALRSASEDADLLVMGSRGRGGFTTMLFGALTLCVVDAACCPVAVINPQQVRAVAPAPAAAPAARTADPMKPGCTGPIMTV